MATATATAHNPEQKPKIEYVLFDMDGLLMYALFSLPWIFIFQFPISNLYFYFILFYMREWGGSFPSPPPAVDRSWHAAYRAAFHNITCGYVVPLWFLVLAF